MAVREAPDASHLWGQDSIFEFDVATGATTELLRLPNHVMGYDWSDDGTRLAFQLRVETATEIEAVSLCLFDSTTASATLIANLQPPIGTGTGQREEARVSWAPDQRSLLVVDTAEEPSLTAVRVADGEIMQSRSGTFGRWLANGDIIFQSDPHTDIPGRWNILSASTGETHAFGLPITAYRPTLSPNGKQLAFDDGDAVEPSIFVFDLEAGTSKRVARRILGPIWLDSGRIVGTVVGPCSEGCALPWTPTGATEGIDVTSGGSFAGVLATTLRTDIRLGVIDVFVAGAASN